MQRTADARGVKSMQRNADAQANKIESIAAGRAIAEHIKGSGHAAIIFRR